MRAGTDRPGAVRHARGRMAGVRSNHTRTALRTLTGNESVGVLW